jgi:hypothetical protein
MKTAEEFLHRTLVSLLSGGAYNVYSDLAPAGAPMPFLVFNIVGGGEQNVRGDRQDARFIIAVRCIALKAQDALTGSAFISQCLNDVGSQDRRPIAVMDTDWIITTMTQNDAVSMTNLYEGATWEYTRGAQFEVVMEAKRNGYI